MLIILYAVGNDPGGYACGGAIWEKGGEVSWECSALISLEAIVR